MPITGIGELRFCSQWAFKHALLSRVLFCISWAFLLSIIMFQNYLLKRSCQAYSTLYMLQNNEICQLISFP